MRGICSLSDARLIMLSISVFQGNQHFFKKLPPGAEASNVLIGMVEFLEHHVSAFIRLKNAQLLGNLTEVRFEPYVLMFIAR